MADGVTTTPPPGFFLDPKVDRTCPPNVRKSAVNSKLVYAPRTEVREAVSAREREKGVEPDAKANRLILWEEDAVVAFHPYDQVVERNECNVEPKPTDSRPLVLTRQLLGLWSALRQQGLAASRFNDDELRKARPSELETDFVLVTEKAFGAVATLVKQDALSRIWQLPRRDLAAVFPTQERARPFVAVAALIHKLATSPKLPPAKFPIAVPPVEEIAMFLHAAENESFDLFTDSNIFLVLAVGMQTENVLMASAANVEICLLKDNTEGLRFRGVSTRSIEPGQQVRVQHSRPLTKADNDEEKELFKAFVTAGAASDPKARAKKLLEKMGLGDFASKD
jgi:hypothetical protein